MEGYLGYRLAREAAVAAAHVQKSRCPQTTAVVPVKCEVGLPPGLRPGAGRAHRGCAAARPSAAPAPAQGAGTLSSPGRLRGLPPALEQGTCHQWTQ